mgnify:CR=1 FL=1
MSIGVGEAILKQLQRQSKKKDVFMNRETRKEKGNFTIPYGRALGALMPVLGYVIFETTTGNLMSITFARMLINLAFYFAREYYTIVRELPAGKGFADVCMIPHRMHLDKPAVVIELKWDKSVSGAIEQIKRNEYIDVLRDYKGNLLLAGINYSKKTKKHTCMIEQVQL